MHDDSGSAIADIESTLTAITAGVALRDVDGSTTTRPVPSGIFNFTNVVLVTAFVSTSAELTPFGDALAPTALVVQTTALRVHVCSPPNADPVRLAWGLGR